jgi:uncharacterized OB-fold protein
MNELLVQRCDSCGMHRYPAARYCAACRNEGAQWVKPSGLGVVESHCSFHKAYWPQWASRVPYAVVQVRLDEGVRLFSSLVGARREDIRSGMRVQACIEDGLVKFRPA